MLMRNDRLRCGGSGRGSNYEGCLWHAQEPITLANSEPEPDIAVIRGNPRDDRARHPGAADVAMVIEIADATLERDRTIKKCLYACAGIPTYWIVNLVESVIEVYSVPGGWDNVSTYQQEQVFGQSETIALMIAGQTVAHLNVGDFLP
jgi:Uma2 family endonuclease